MPIIDGQTLPVLVSAGAFVHKIAGSFPEYEVEPRILREGDGYLKGCRVLETSALSTADTESIIAVLTNPNSYGDRGMGARCFFPGLAFSFGTDEENVHVQVCLECSWVVFHPSPAPRAACRAKKVKAN